MRSVFYLAMWSIFLLLGCQKVEITISENAFDHFFLKNDEAEMPVWVEGNTASKTFVIFLHGGPGGSSIGYNELNVFSVLEEKYGLVYWDQRCAGASQGNCNSGSLTVESYVKDVDKLISVLKFRYGSNLSIFLLGDSWGSTLATAYMTTDDFQQNLKGVIATVGVHNFPLWMQSKKNILEYYGNQQISLGNRVNEWQNIIGDISKVDLTKIEGLNTLQKYGYQAQQYLEEIDSIKSITLSGGKPNSLGFSFVVNNLVTSNVMWPQLLTLDLSPRLSKVNIPVALYYGKYDFVVPPAVGVDFYNSLNTKKEIFIFAHSDHNLGISNGIDLYQEKVVKFIETYK
ncbi:MAG: alpha/beta fold hydrolase [Saprospiraceae bacterium]